ncbi:MAG: bifunctional glutamate N-acetyltransferase/amino-acid acetyltransferase ArgJ [Actinomycetota bacterium]|nr:bifunctional glutamate N-acetyltransferase/amino-acid acetyltransferase ArgJ [Actinomycetota bacterium]
MTALPLPLGFRAYVANVGVKDTTDDFTVVAAAGPCAAAGVFTKSSFAGPSVLVSREHVASGSARAMVVLSKNANVATGEAGLADAREVVAGVAAALGCAPADVLIASTGVIGRRYPMDRIRAGLAAIPTPLPGTDAAAVARGIMTTDTVPKTASATVGAVTIVGVAKGVGMIEPDMATMIAMFFTDASLPASVLDSVFRSVIDRTFNCVSVDTDTSTSDTAVILASGVAGAVDVDAFTDALYDVAESLTKQVARDGEGATTLIEVAVDGAATYEQAKRVAKAIVNSPLVKTAVHGADPNWGRVAMAVGKSTSATEVDQARVVIRFGSQAAEQEVYPAPLDEAGLAALSQYMRGDDVRIHVTLAAPGGTRGAASATVWGCDLTDGYVRINADYTT